jgi:hypothetical protein
VANMTRKLKCFRWNSGYALWKHINIEKFLQFC